MLTAPEGNPDFWRRSQPYDGGMAYRAELSGGQILRVEQQGEQTRIGVEGGGQQQSTSATTGPWQAAPRLYRLGDQVVLELRAQGTHYYSVQGGGLHALGTRPDLDGAQTVEMKEIPDGQPDGMKPMETMKPLKPLKPM